MAALAGLAWRQQHLEQRLVGTERTQWGPERQTVNITLRLSVTTVQCSPLIAVNFTKFPDLIK